MYICPYAYRLSNGLFSCEPREENIREQIRKQLTIEAIEDMNKYLNFAHPLCPKNVKRNASGITICWET